jgi:hypothetical protein
VILHKSVVQLLVVLANLLDLLLLVVLYLTYLALQLVDFFLLLFGVLGSLLPQAKQVALAVRLRLLERVDLGLELLDHLGVGVLLLGRSGEHLLHDDFVV